MVYRGSIYLAETDKKAQDWFESLKGAASVPAIPLRRTVSEAIQAARSGEQFDLRNVIAGSPEGDVVGNAVGLTFMGGPDTVFQQIKAFHDRCGFGVLDLFFQQSSVDHRDVMKEIELFGKEVLPRIKEL